MINKRGKIQLIIGPMFSGKSTELLAKIRRYNIKKKKTVVVTFEQDLRYTEQNLLITHDKTEYPAIRCSTLNCIQSQLINYDVIGIDEGQFFPDLVEICDDLANNGKIIVISALSGNFKREPFEIISYMIAKSDKIINVRAICYNCNDNANYSLRTIKDDREILVGGEELYKPCCRGCHKIIDEIDKSN